MSTWPVDQRTSQSPDTRLRQNAMRLMVGRDEESRQTADQVTALALWPALFDLCGQWKLLAGLEARIATLVIALPEAERADLSRRTQPAFLQTMLCIRAGATALTALERAAIPCAGFKGLAALTYLYPGYRSRTLQDTDALIHPRDVEAALRVLEAAGFKRSPDSPWRGVRRLPQKLARHRRQRSREPSRRARRMRGPALAPRQLGSGDAPCRCPSRAGAQSVSPPDEPRPLHVALRPSCPAQRLRTRRHRPATSATSPIGGLCWTRPASGNFLGASAERWGLSAACAALAFIVAELQGDAKPEPPLPLSRASHTVARQLSAFYFHQLHAGPINTDLAYVASTRPLRQIATGLAGGWNTYREFMRRSEESNGEVSLSVHERVWNLARSLTALSPGRWRQVRALARAKDKMAGPSPPEGNQ